MVMAAKAMGRPSQRRMRFPMLSLREEGLKNRQEWLNRGYTLPQFDRAAMIENTRRAPRWVHFGAGNIFRAFQCNAVQDLLNRGLMDTGIVAVERGGNDRD